jgi:hypothetical protein
MFVGMIVRGVRVRVNWMPLILVRAALRMTVVFVAMTVVSVRHPLPHFAPLPQL